ncbi:hypothetical protein B0H14DRAFT_3449809 [Mycena olivaceomarginata]|nr:hypothetical protein B0H14DRAFT_3449809 [Mycena olivaceomarginata]
MRTINTACYHRYLLHPLPATRYLLLLLPATCYTATRYTATCYPLPATRYLHRLPATRYTATRYPLPATHYRYPLHRYPLPSRLCEQSAKAPLEIALPTPSPKAGS